MPQIKLTKKETQQIDSAVALFESNKTLFDAFAMALCTHLTENSKLSPYIHFIKYRVKTPESLRMKLERKACKRKREGKKPDINCDNLFTKITDLAGVRILHLHTEQMQEINTLICDTLREQHYSLLEGPTAKCWDLEYERIFKEFGIDTTNTESMYISVHYIIGVSETRWPIVELQVRTLMDEVWGEVSHRVDYPVKSTVQSCRDQLKVLARLTSGCVRLVDSIFKSSRRR
ncbi:MAG: RelA/SpoT domain-containing protein [Alphaproteobacteria bacterium]|nr:RelA/SpoT domain-containing protein [Alphaproteobacteria bacterium]